MTTQDLAQDITYGNIRRPSKGGLFGLPVGALALMFPLILVMIAFVSTQRWLAAVVVVAAMAVVVAPAYLPARGGRTQYQHWALRVAHRRAENAGHNLYLAGPAGRTPDGMCRLPGLLAPSELSEHADSYGSPFGLLTLAAAKHRQHTVVLEAHASGSESVDQHVVDRLVAHWGAWLANLGLDDAVVGASVTVETAPDSGLRLQRMAVSNTVQAAPEFARATVGAITDSAAGVPAITTRIAITFTGKGAKKDGIPDRSTAQMATDIGNRLPALISGLRETGAGTTVRACIAQDVIDFTRAAYDPAAALAIEEARQGQGTDLTWEEAGPVYARDLPDVYRHDRAFSTSFEMSEGPRGLYHSTSLQRLLAPHPDIERKRVTIMYRPVKNPSDVVEKDVNAEVFGTSGGPRVTARQQASLAAARQAAREEAAGAGLVRFGIIVTVTTTDPATLPQAVRAVTFLVGPARLRLRPALCNQAVAFTAGLPLGVVLPEHTALPTHVRDAL